MIRGFKVKLHPTLEQRGQLIKAFGVSRWVYNWCINRQKENFAAGGKFIDGYKLRKEITALKKKKEYNWLNEVSAKVSAQAALDLCEAFKKFFRKEAGYPKFKCKKNNNDSFYQRKDQFVIKDNKVLIERIGYIDMAESIIPVGIGVKYYNPRVKHDGIDIWITVGVEVSKNQTESTITEPIGIDLGLKNLAVDSNGKKHKRPSVRRELKRLKRLQRKASRIYLYMKNSNISYKEKSKRLIKLERQILKIHHRINNVLKDNIHKITTTFVKMNPSAVVIEDLNIKGMFKNRHLAHKLKYAKLGEVIRQIKYKCTFNNIKLIVADRWYASSKICSCCGYKKERLSLSERVFTCEKCNLTIDRDYNAALNLKALAV